MLMLLPIACIPAGTYPLQALPETDGALDFLHAQGVATLDHDPSQGWDLQLDLTLRNDGQGRPRVDLVNAHVRVDEVSWAACRHPDTVDQEKLFLTLGPGEQVLTTLTCLDVPRPQSSLEVRFGATLAGGRGVVELRYGGVL